MLHPSHLRWTPLGRSLLLIAMGCLLLIRDVPAPLDAQAALGPVQTAGATTPATQPLPDLSALPLAFEPNVGQADPAARFMAHTGSGALLFTPGSVVLVLDAPISVPTSAGVAFRHAPDLLAPPPPRPPAPRVRLRWARANAAPTLVGGTRLPGLINYLHGNDPAHWQTAVPTYSALTYQGLYPGIDLHYSGGAGGLKGTYTVAPGADPTRIRWRYEGADPPRVDAHGDLHLRVPAPTGSTDGPAAAPATLTEQAPLAWQDRAGDRVPVASRFTVAADGSIGFALGSYDPGAALTLDPYLLYADAFGNGNTTGLGIATDATGATYITGYVNGPGYPTVDPFQPTFGGAGDAFVTKLNPAGTTLIYSTFLGGGGIDYGQAIAVDSAGQAYVTGTAHGNFPTLHGYQNTQPGVQSAFVTVLTAQGSALVYSTYLGGRYYDEGGGIAVTPNGWATVTGYAESSDFPTYHALYTGGQVQAFVAEFSPLGALVYSTILPGTGKGHSVALDAAENAYVTGETQSSGLPALHAVQPQYGGGPSDGFVVALAAHGTALRYAGYLGGGGRDIGWSIAVDGAGQATVTGATTSGDLLPPVGPLLLTPPLQPTLNGPSDAFVVRYTAGGNQLRYGTYFGGSGEEQGFGVAVDPSGAAYVVGATNSGDLPTLHAAQWRFAGGLDAYLVKLNAAGTNLTYSTYLGGRSLDLGYAAVAASQGTAYITGKTLSDDFPNTRPIAGVPPGYGVFVSAMGDSCPLQFSDVAAGSTFDAYIGCLACRGIVSGYSDGTYQPGAGLTRGQLAKIVAGAAVLTATIPLTQQTFADVQPNSTFWVYVERAAAAGLVSGYTCGTVPAEPCDGGQRPYYRPGVGVTRGQTAKLVSQGAGWTDPIPLAQQTFSDVRPGDTFWGTIERTALHGSIAGYSCGPGGPGPCDEQRRPYYLPGAGVTRGQAAKIVGNSFFPQCETRPPTATPVPTVTATPPVPSVTATTTASATGTASATATVPAPTASATVTATDTAAPSVTATASATPPGSSPTPTTSPTALLR